MQSKLAIIREEPEYENPNQTDKVPSVGTAVLPSPPRSPASMNSIDDECVVVFKTKQDYMNQDAFDTITRAHGIEEEISHRISRVETHLGELIPDPQWDDPCAECFPVRCIYHKINKNNPPSPPITMPSSMPTTPEPPMRELSDDSSSVAASLLTQQLQVPMVGTLAPMCPFGSPSPLAWYRVAFCGGISIRTGPDSQAPCTGQTLPCNDVFAVTESLFGLDQRVYLRLADGSGWVFDDSLLFPDDPSVRKLPFAIAPDIDPMDSLCGKTTQFATAPQTPLLYREGCVTPSASSFASSPATPSPLCGSPLATSPAPTLFGFEDDYGIPMIPVASMPYQVQVPGGICVRVAPGLDAPLTGLRLSQGEVFHASESVYGADGRQYLRLADGQGWVLAETLPEQESQIANSSDFSSVGLEVASASQHATSEGKSKARETRAQSHVPYWVRLRRAKLAGVPLGQKKGKSCATKA